MIGVLALQGAFKKHMDCLNLIDCPSVEVKHPSQLRDCLGLVIPGGETTSHLRLIHPNFWMELQKFGQTKPIFGTCCGLILLSQEIIGHKLPTLQLMDISTERNAYGRQVDSFVDEVSVNLHSEEKQVEGCFIRAPKIKRVGKSVTTLASYQGEPVVVENQLHLAASFHPELTNDTTLHQYFTARCFQLAC